MRRVNVVLQNKGGVGKTLVAARIVDRYRVQGQDVVLIDTNPFMGGPLQISEYARRDKSEFTEVMNRIMNEQRDVVLDVSGTVTLRYREAFLYGDAVSRLSESGAQVLLHMPVVGGGAMEATLNAVDEVARQLPQPAKIVVWENDYFGPVMLDGKKLQELEVYLRNKTRISHIDWLGSPAGHKPNELVQRMLRLRLTLGEVSASSEFTAEEKRQIAEWGRGMFAKLAGRF